MKQKLLLEELLERQIEKKERKENGKLRKNGRESKKMSRI